MAKEDNELKDVLENMIDGLNSIDGKVVGEDGEFIKTEMGKDDRDAWVKHMVEQYLKGETLNTPPEEMEITTIDIMEEIARREISKIFGK